jgi:hypothetical protein
VDGILLPGLITSRVIPGEDDGMMSLFEEHGQSKAFGFTMG